VQQLLSQSLLTWQGQLALLPPMQNFGPRHRLLAHSALLVQDAPTSFRQLPPPQVVPRGQLLLFSWQVPARQVSGLSRTVFTQVAELLPQATPLTAFAQRLAVQTWQAPQSTSLQQFPLTQVDPQWSRPVWHWIVEQVCPADQSLHIPHPFRPIQS
jgi:hypothetical protein